MLFQASNISPDEINGTGAVDITENLNVSWQVNGDSAMTAYQIVIYENNAASTQVYSTGKVTLSEPFWGVNYKGETQYYTSTLQSSALTGAGMSNGNEYKLLITQWWGTNSIQQTTASLFITRETPSVIISTIPNPLTEKAYSFTAVYTQAQGDALKWIRWQIAEADNLTEPFLDTGNITGTGQLQVDYDGFFTDTEYAIQVSIETINGMGASSGWQNFSVEYEVGEAQGQVTACQLTDDSAVFLSWDQMEVAQGYSILRRKSGESFLTKIADVDSTTGQLRDYSARSGETYIYYVFPTGALAYLTEPMVSEPVEVQFWFWSIIEAQQNGSSNYYSVIKTHIFEMGSGGVAEGNFSNNNSPQIAKNFTKFPTRMPETANYLTGSVSGYIGTIDYENMTYGDTVAQSTAIRELSHSQNALFLLDPKGHFLKIHTSGAISLSINHKNKYMPQTMTVPWVEIGSTEGLALSSAPGGEFYPNDEVIGTMFSIDLNTGALIWTTPTEYGNGSIMSLGANGGLIQTADGSFTRAQMALDQNTGEVSATL